MTRRRTRAQVEAAADRLEADLDDALRMWHDLYGAADRLFTAGAGDGLRDLGYQPADIARIDARTVGEWYTPDTPLDGPGTTAEVAADIAAQAPRR